MATVDVRGKEATAGGGLGELYARHAPDAARLAYLLTGDRSLAQDLVHEAFVRMIGRFRDLRNPEAFDWYLRRTLVNLVNSHFRHAGVESRYLQRAGTETRSALAPDLEGRDEMWRRLQGLPERQRVALVLRFYEDLTEPRIAELMGCPVGTVKSLVSRGLARLRGELIERAEG